jgi:hypothetical protein
MDGGGRIQAGIGQQAGEAHAIFCANVAMQHRPPHVSIHQEDALPHLGQRLGKQGGGGAFAFPLGGRG